MKIRAVTLGLDLPSPTVTAAPFASAGKFLTRAKQAFGEAGLEVQTTRVVGPSLAKNMPPDLAKWSQETETVARGHGVEFLSLGRLASSQHTVVAAELADVLASTEVSFFSADLIEANLPSVDMARSCASMVKALSNLTAQGFGNLRFAATASCPPNIPFLPAAYHTGGPPRFAIAVEAADVVVRAFSGPGGISELEDRLVKHLEEACAPLERVADELAAESGFGYVGVDLSPAPFPSDDRSVGAAMELAGVDQFGAPGTLYVAAMLTRAIRRTRLRRCGFSGLMLPLLEDSVLARRTAERPASLHELLLYSAVCGTGLDTVPLPGDVSEAELAGVYLDVAALSVALGGKPLTVRVMPVPGAKMGDQTNFTFEYFENSRVLPITGRGASGILERGQ